MKANPRIPNINGVVDQTVWRRDLAMLDFNVNPNVVLIVFRNVSVRKHESRPSVSGFGVVNT
jgi:hypothetical protein